MFRALKSRWAWRPIPNCPGRFVMSGGATRLTPVEIVGSDTPTTEHHVSTATDPVVVARFADGGLISYKKADGTFVHTLNTIEGFERKLHQFGIART